MKGCQDVTYATASTVSIFWRTGSKHEKEDIFLSRMCDHTLQSSRTPLTREMMDRIFKSRTPQFECNPDEIIQKV